MLENQNTGLSETPSAADAADQAAMAGSVPEFAAVMSVSPYEAMCKAIRSSGRWMIAWAIFSLFQPNISWAAVLVVVTLMSFYFYDVAAMFLVYAGLMFYAAVSNLISGEPGWILMAIVQTIFGAFALQEYRLNRNTKPDESAGPPSPESPARLTSQREAKMAWLALLLALVGLAGWCSVIPAGMVLYNMPDKTVESAVYVVLEVMWELGILGMPVGIAALSINRRTRWPAVTGIVIGALTILLMILLATVGA